MRRDDAYLLDMLVAARKALTFAAELTYPQVSMTRRQYLSDRTPGSTRSGQKRATTCMALVDWLPIMSLMTERGKG